MLIKIITDHRLKIALLLSPLLLAFTLAHTPSDVNPDKTEGKLLVKVDGATIHGSVTLPSQGQQQERVFRGSAYRGRGNNSSANRGKDEGKQFTPLENTIISAHPLSYEPDTQPLEEPAQINQENATFMPHVTPVTVGTTVQFINNDPFYHNVFSLKPGARFNIGRRPTGEVVSQKIPRIEEVTIQGLGEISIFCDIHSQMNAIILSLDTPHFDRVGNDGTYRLEGLPAGRYEIRAYNPQFNISSVEVTISEDGDIKQDFNISN